MSNYLKSLLEPLIGLSYNSMYLLDVLLDSGILGTVGFLGFGNVTDELLKY